MRDLGSLIIVHLVESIETGAVFPRKRAEWPLHITLVPWFYLADDQREAFLQALTELAAAYAPFTVNVGEEEKFGPDKDVSVNLLVEQAPVRSLHAGRPDREDDRCRQQAAGRIRQAGREQREEGSGRDPGRDRCGERRLPGRRA